MLSLDRHAQSSQEFCTLILHLVFLHSDEMIYDDVENGDEGGHSSLEYGWSSSEFESYEEQSDSESRSGVPRSFLRGDHRKQAGVPAVCWGTACSHGRVASFMLSLHNCFLRC